MAADYVQTLLTQQAQGPYRLAGVSFGGVLAFEMAQQLRRAGHEVAFLGLLDSMLPGSVHRQLLPRVVRRAGRLLRRLASKAKDADWQDQLRPGSDIDETERRIGQQREAIYLRAIRAYRPQRYEGPVVLARSQDQELQSGESIDPTYRWGRLVPNLQVVDVPGDHLGLLSPPHVSELADSLQLHLRRGRAR
jgi:thioesterase domain-containing protein